ncbi:MAG: hypothetical protein ACRDMA_18410 [Solirubrobacterales bacterium]
MFEVFMAQHAPVGALVDHANRVLWDESAVHPVVKERMRIALAETIGCSYCARFRTDQAGELVLDGAAELTSEERLKAELAERYARAVIERGASPPDGLTVEMQERFPEGEFADLVFSLGWFIGMQHVGRLLHWDDACPVSQIRTLVEAGEAA